MNLLTDKQTYKQTPSKNITLHGGVVRLLTEHKKKIKRIVGLNNSAKGHEF